MRHVAHEYVMNEQLDVYATHGAQLRGPRQKDAFAHTDFESRRLVR